ncbi:hypothetical protein WS70_17535 [Burkholderia mayonis]|uniref:Flagellar motor switch protein FliN-like C-terminal domain-containing protein n=1 Tax=Burkholderia mayonis TaxID=1385591 RepID=A0A1B4FJB6_9BURK|nr:hypothetical protein WS70_17535 [Burkholderia mayonis]KVE41579.1 hypothetical protein WS69_05410 [Burkholderia sp. BDU5]KVE46908.1 hypothetical protein WS70_01440 [Burkholderia mayonis]
MSFTEQIATNAHVESPQPFDGDFRLRCADVLSRVEWHTLNQLIALSCRRIGFRPLGDAKSNGTERATCLVTDIGGVRIAIYFAGYRRGPHRRWFAFDSLSPAMRAELWSLRNAGLLDALEQVFAAPVSIHAVADEAVPAGLMRVSLRLAWIEIGCWADAATAARALVPTRAHRLPALPALSALPVACTLRLRGVRLDRAEYLALGFGDIVVIGRESTGPLRGELVADGLGYRYPVACEKEGTVMIEQDEMTLDTRSARADLDDRHVELTVVLATCRMTLGELANLRSGQVLRLAKAADEMSVDLCYCDSRFAQGRLVEIDGLLGVRIDAMSVSAAA